VLTAGLSLEPVEGTLRTLGLVLGLLSAAVWCTAAVLSRVLCRQALAPVARMAAAARSMGAGDLAERLPVPDAGDELTDLGRAFNGLLDRLQEAFERQRRFTGDASHQLRTPLTAMLGQVEVALRRDRPAGDYRAALERVQGQAARLRQVVEMLLFLARADAEARPAELEAVDLAAWLPAHLETWSGHERQPDLRLVVASGSSVWVRVHGPLLGQLLDNLLENACKYSRPGTPVVIGLGSEGGWVTLAVEDAGDGIAPEDLPHIFEPFYRAPQARRHGLAGVGLGLAVCRRIAAAFGGTVEAQSAPGRGSRFVLRLPEVVGDGAPNR
jgi:heavy metal sensor kinase